LLRAGPNGVFRLVGAVVCFPSGWAPREKLGRTVAEIHGIVPTLNPTLGRQIEGFLGRLDPGSSWERDNWGLSRGAELNRHPYRNLPRLDEATPLEEVFLRVEHQLFFRLPGRSGCCSHLALSLHPLAELMTNPEAAAGLQRALTSMPEGSWCTKGRGYPTPTRRTTRKIEGRVDQGHRELSAAGVRRPSTSRGRTCSLCTRSVAMISSADFSPQQEEAY
jgi:hypothetical protein